VNLATFAQAASIQVYVDLKALLTSMNELKTQVTMPKRQTKCSPNTGVHVHLFLIVAHVPSEDLAHLTMVFKVQLS